tara:strand:+ start:1341 stop:2312 length:972 start_codon:yes stop_codon:yes gene_type:complete
MKNLNFAICQDNNIWDTFVGTSPQGSIFCESRFLSISDPNCERWILYKNDSPIAAIPVNVSPADSNSFSYYQGPLYAHQMGQMSHYRRYKWIQEINQVFFPELVSRYSKFSLSMHYSIQDVRSFDWFNYHQPQHGRFKISPKYTALVDLNSLSNFDELIPLVKKKRRQDRRISIERGIVVEESDDIGIIQELYRMTYTKQGLDEPKGIIDEISLVGESSFRHGFGEMIVARDGSGMPLSAQLTFYDNASAHAIVAANHPEYQSMGGGTIIAFEFIKRALNKGLKWADFNGANSPDRADFKHSLNAFPQLYFTADFESLKKDLN